MTTRIQTKLYSCSGAFLRETPKAVLIKFFSIESESLKEPKTCWIPKSQIADTKFAAEPEFPGDEKELDVFNIKEWILQQNQLV